MENCLVTKLKGVVDNSDLVELGHIRLVKINNDGYCVIKPKTGESAIVIKSINNESVNLTIPPGYDSNIIATTVGAAPVGTILDVSGKYSLGEVDIAGGFCEISTEMFKYSKVFFWASYSNENLFYGDIANLANPNVDYFRSLNIRNNNLSGNISCLIGKLANFTSDHEMNLSNNPNLEGVLSADFLDFAGYKINIIGTKITTTQDVLDAFAAKNVTITYDQSQVIG